MAPSPRRPRAVHGDDLLYEFFQHVLTEENNAFEAIPQLLLQTMGIWLPLEVYASWPVLLPFVVRDPTCRGRPEAGKPDEWGSPNDAGYLRDDNSLVKGLPRALDIDGPPDRRISGARMGTEFVAAHVWRTVIGTATLASRLPSLNTFVPNLVWLPGQIAKLTDREGSVVQRTAQAIAWSIYRNAPVAPHLVEITEDNWSLIPAPDRRLEPFDLTSLNWFRATPAFFAVRAARLQAVISALKAIHNNKVIDTKVVTTRYTQGLPAVSPASVEHLLDSLIRYLPPPVAR